MATAKRTQNKTDSNRDNAGDFIGSFSITQSCDPCMKSNISKTATEFCVNCDEFLCDTCKHPHCVYKPGKHKIIGIRDMLDMKGLDRCQEHSHEVKLYCQDHSKLCCSTCAILHKKCHQLDEIDRLSERNPTYLLALKPSLLTLQSDAESILAECKKPDNNLNRSISNMSSEIDTMKDRIIKLFDAAKKNFLFEANALKSEKMRSRQDTCSKVKEEVNQMLSMCTAIEENGKPQQKYIVWKRIEEKQKTLQAEQRTLNMSLTFPRELTALLEMGNSFIKLNCQETTEVPVPSAQTLLPPTRAPRSSKLNPVDPHTFNCGYNETSDPKSPHLLPVKGGAISSEYFGRGCLCADTDRLGNSDLNASQTLGQDEISESSGDLQNDCTVCVYNTLKSSDVSSSVENSLKSTYVSPAVENTLNSTDVSPSVDNRLKSADVSPSVYMILKSTDVSPSVDNRLKNTDVMPNVENSLKSTDVSLIQLLVQDSNTASSNLKLESISDVEFTVSGIDLMSDGRLVTVYKNKQCILMNDKLVKIGKKYLLRAIPVGVVCMSDNEIAVALTNKTICVLVVEKDCVIREKRTFITNVQYLALRKLDDSTLVGFTRGIPEHARKITMNGREEDFTTLKKRDYTSMCPEYDCKCVYIPSQNKFLTRDTENKLHIHDTNTGFNKGVQFEKKIYAVCQGLEGSAMVVCDSEVVQMTMKGVILRKCNLSGYALMVCAHKSFSTLAIASSDIITLYSSTATTTWSLEPRALLEFTINGLDFLPDGRLVAVFANKTCVIMNYKLNKIGKRFLFTARPLGVVWISDNDIAVALDNMTICILSVENDNVMKQKCSFTTQVQYYALRKLDSTTIVGFEAERARKITMDGMEKDFKSFVKTGYPSACPVFNCKYACIPCIHKLATFDKETNVVYLQDPEKGTSKCVQFEKEIYALCQGPAGTVFVVCKGEFVQMSCEGRTLNKCSYTGFARNVCANKDFSVIALSDFTTVRLYKLSI